LTSFIVLQYQRVFNETEYLEQFGKGSSMPSFKNIQTDLGGLLIDNIRELFLRKKEVREGNEIKTINEFSSNGIMLAVIYVIIYIVLYKIGKFNMSNTFFFISIPVVLFFISWYLVVLINHCWYVYTKISTYNSVTKTPSTI